MAMYAIATMPLIKQLKVSTEVEQVWLLTIRQQVGRLKNPQAVGQNS